MPDLDSLAEILTTARPRKMCPIAKAIEGFDSPLKEIIAQAIEEIDPSTGKHVWSAPNLVNLVNDKADLNLNSSTMIRHRTGKCSCSRRKEN